MKFEDPAYFKSLQYLLDNPVSDLGSDITFSVEVDEFGALISKDLKQNGSEIVVTDETKSEYVSLVCDMKMTGMILIWFPAINKINLEIKLYSI